MSQRHRPHVSRGVCCLVFRFTGSDEQVFESQDFTVHMILFDLHHSGTQFFLGIVDIFLGPKIRQQAIFFSLYSTSTKKAVSVRTLF